MQYNVYAALFSEFDNPSAHVAPRLPDNESRCCPACAANAEPFIDTHSEHPSDV